MFSVSQINNKKWSLLAIIMVASLNLQCSEGGPGVYLKGFGDSNNPIHIQLNNSSSGQPEESTIYSVGKILLPVVAGAAINYIIQQYNADPEMNALLKEEKKFELLIKQHSDYPAIQIQRQRNEALEKANENKEKQLKLHIDEATIIEHHQEKVRLFTKCDKEAGFTQDFCNQAVLMHMQALESLGNK